MSTVDERTYEQDLIQILREASVGDVPWSVRIEPLVGALRPDLVFVDRRGRWYLVEIEITERHVHVGSVMRAAALRDSLSAISSSSAVNALFVTRVLPESIRQTAVDLGLHVVEVGHDDFSSAALKVAAALETLASAQVEEAEGDADDLVDALMRAVRRTVGAHGAERAYAAGRLDDVEAWIREFEPVLESADVLEVVRWHGLRAKLAAVANEFDDAEREGRLAMTLAVRSDSALAFPHALMNMAEVFTLAARPSEAAALLEEAIVRFERALDANGAATARRALRALAEEAAGDR